MKDIIVRRHRAWLEVTEAPTRIVISLEMLLHLDPDTTHLFGHTLTVQNGPTHTGGHVSYLIDGWNGYALTAHKVEDTRPASKPVEIIDLKPKGTHHAP